MTERRPEEMSMMDRLAEIAAIVEQASDEAGRPPGETEPYDFEYEDMQRIYALAKGRTP